MNDILFFLGIDGIFYFDILERKKMEYNSYFIECDALEQSDEFQNRKRKKK